MPSPSISDEVNAEHEANTLYENGRPADAFERYLKALSTSERPARVLQAMASICTQFGRVAQAADLLHLAHKLEPQSPEILASLAHCFCSMGEVAAALDTFRASLELDPQCPPVWSRLLMTSLYAPHLSRAQLFQLHRDAAAAIQAPATCVSVGDRAENRRRRQIQVAFVSPDFRGHSVAALIEPVLRYLDRSRFEVTCYSDTRIEDETTSKLKALDLVWRDTRALTHAELAQLIRAEQIDILVDLAGHTDGNRMPVLAAKPAPTQVSMLGYANTTGLDAIDFRLADSFTDPSPAAEEFHSETLFRIDPCFFCYQPPFEIPLSRRETICPDRFVFCSFNALPKLSSPTIELWAAVLRAAPDSVLLLKSLELADPETGRKLKSRFAQHGVPEETIHILPPVASREDHLRLYLSADCALDPFPYSGTITTCEALWMGVPVISLPGETHVSRVTGSILRAIGRDGWTARSAEQYVKIANGLARYGNRSLAEREELRQAMRMSPLLNHREYVRKLERAFAAMHYAAFSGLSAPPRQPSARPRCEVSAAHA